MAFWILEGRLCRKKTQDMHLNHLKLKINYNYKKDEKITIKVETSDDPDANKTYLDEKLSKKAGQISYLEKKRRI